MLPIIIVTLMLIGSAITIIWHLRANALDNLITTYRIIRALSWVVAVIVPIASIMQHPEEPVSRQYIIGIIVITIVAMIAIRLLNSLSTILLLAFTIRHHALYGHVVHDRDNVKLMLGLLHLWSWLIALRYCFDRDEMNRDINSIMQQSN